MLPGPQPTRAAQVTEGSLASGVPQPAGACPGFCPAILPVPFVLGEGGRKAQCTFLGPGNSSLWPCPSLMEAELQPSASQTPCWPQDIPRSLVPS